MLHDILTSIPEQISRGLADETIIRVGGLLKDTIAEKVVAHLQMTGLGQVLSLPFSVLKLHPIEIIKDLQLKQMVDGLTLLQYSNIGVASLGLGVSVIGFIHLHKKIKGLESSIESLSVKMDRHFQDLYEREMRRKFIEIHALFGQLEQLQHLSNLDYKRARSIDIESGLYFSSEFLRSEIAHHWHQDQFNLEWFNTLVSCLLICDSSRIQCLLMSNELLAAKYASEKISDSYCDLFDMVGPVKLGNKLLLGSDEKEVTYSQIESEAFKVSDGLSEITHSSLTKSLLIEHLIDKGVSGDQFISEMNANKQCPFVLIRV